MLCLLRASTDSISIPSRGPEPMSTSPPRAPGSPSPAEPARATKLARRALRQEIKEKLNTNKDTTNKEATNKDITNEEATNKKKYQCITCDLQKISKKKLLKHLTGQFINTVYKNVNVFIHLQKRIFDTMKHV